MPTDNCLRFPYKGCLDWYSDSRFSCNFQLFSFKLDAFRIECSVSNNPFIKPPLWSLSRVICCGGLSRSVNLLETAPFYHTQFTTFYSRCQWRRQQNTVTVHSQVYSGVGRLYTHMRIPVVSSTTPNSVSCQIWVKNCNTITWLVMLIDSVPFMFSLRFLQCQVGLDPTTLFISSCNKFFSNSSSSSRASAWWCRPLQWTYPRRTPWQRPVLLPWQQMPFPWRRWKRWQPDQVFLPPRWVFICVDHVYGHIDTIVLNKQNS